MKIAASPGLESNRLLDLLDRYLLLIPAGVALILSLPVMGFTYLWDDFNFLTNAMFYQLYDWVPRAVDPFYRPLSRGVYFTVLDLAGKYGPLLGHILNLGFLIAIVLLLGSLMSRIAGRKAGLISGFLFAGLGAAPMLVGWICCDQDLLAMLFVLVSLHFRLQQRSGAALAAAAGGLLSKETTLAVIPALMLFDWIIGRKPYRIWRNIGVYATLIVIWGAVHPAVRTLVARGLRSGATGYVGLEHPERWFGYFGRYLLSLFNLPAYSPPPGWPVFGVLLLAVTLAITVAALRRVKDDPRVDEDVQPIPRSRVLLLGALLAVGPLVLTSTMIHVWSPYYAAFPALGVAMIGGVLLAPHSARLQIIALAVYFTFGMWTRGPAGKPTDTTESNFGVASTALRKVESGFRRLYPAFPPGAQVILSVQARGRGSVYIHMYAFQVLRIWYRDRSIYTVRPEARRPGDRAELVMVITPDRDVIDINPATMFARSASGREPDYNICEGAVRAYAMGLAGSGNTDAAVNLLLHMPELNRGLEIVHRRMAAMFLFAEERDREGEAILHVTYELPRGLALEDLKAVLAEQPPGRIYDEYALRAFGISQGDTDASRSLMRWFAGMKYAEVALRFAQRLDQLRPGDAEAAEVIGGMTRVLAERRSAPPAAAAVE